MFLAQRFVRWYAPDEVVAELRPGEPPQADVLWTRPAEQDGIEIGDALFGDHDGQQLFSSLRSRVPAADASLVTRPVGVADAGFLTASSSHGLPELAIPVVLNPLALAARMTEVGMTHCATTYAPADRLFLILNGGNRPLLRPEDAAVVAEGVTLDDRGQFDEVFVCVTLNDRFERAFIRIL